jgi:hypothetical protein
MAHSKSKIDWILLIHQLPPKPTNLRVSTWRKLQKLGAVSIKNSVYVLPFNDKTHEDFQWLKQEIESLGGEATVFRADAVEGATDSEIISQFRKQRSEDYAQVTAELDGLTGKIREQKRGGHISAGRINTYETEIEKLHKELERILAVDFFDAPNRSTATAAYERCRTLVQSSQNRNRTAMETTKGKGVAVNLSEYQGRRWVTRRNLFVDRLATIWLIKRFIDKRPRFYFVSDEEIVEGAIRFDMYGAEFSHRGEDCTFETMIKEFGLTSDSGLRDVAEVIHDIDLKDIKFNRSEAAGLKAVISGLADLLTDDRKLIQQVLPLFDGLYKLFSQSELPKKGKTANGKRIYSRKPERKK